MRRSSDGYISATGMFKASFPYAEAAEEDRERKYIKGLPTTSHEETAGNIWIPAEHALELASEYQITPWIKALLDPAPIETGVGVPKEGSSPKNASTPPPFLMPQQTLAVPPEASSPSPVPAATRGRPRRAASPSKIASPKKLAGSARARKTTNKTPSKAGSVEPSSSARALQDLVSSKTSPKDNDTEEPVVRVAVDTEVEVNGDVETTHTHVEVEMPAGLPSLPLPEDTAAMIAKAKEMVEAATKHSELTATEPSKKSKRKAEDIEVEEDDNEGSQLVPSKKARMETIVETEMRLKKEKVQKRALIGISAAMAIR